MSATRSDPLPLDEDGLPIQTRIRSHAESTALNVVAILRETWEDFRNADRYFKVKAAILGAWAVLSLAGVFVACPAAPNLGGPSTSLARSGWASATCATITARRRGVPKVLASRAMPG